MAGTASEVTPVTPERVVVQPEVTCREILEDFWGDEWATAKSLYATRDDLEDTAESAGLRPWTEVAAEAREAAVAIYERDLVFMRDTLAGHQGGVTADELVDMYGVDPQSDLGGVLLTIRPYTQEIDYDLQRLGDLLVGELDSAVKEVFDRQDVERYPLAMPSARPNPGDIHRIYVDAGGWKVVYRINEDEFPAVREIMEKCVSARTRRRDLIRGLLRDR